MRMRSFIRGISRDEARRLARKSGIEVRYEPAAAPECGQHHRRLPCKRCPESGS